MYVCLHAGPRIHTYIHIVMITVSQPAIHTYIHTYIYTYIHPEAYTQSGTQAFIHTDWLAGMLTD